MFNSKNLGALIVDEDPHVKSWEDGQYNIMNMSVEETFGLGILQEGQAVAVAKNVKIRPNEFVMPARTVFNLGPSSLTTTSLAGGPAGDRIPRPPSTISLLRLGVASFDLSFNAGCSQFIVFDGLGRCAL